MKTFNENKNRYIKLETAQRALCAECFWSGRCKESCWDYKRLAALPAEEVEPIRWASWEIQEDGSARCSSCGLIIHAALEGAGKTREVLPRRCENCGAHIAFDFKEERKEADENQKNE